MHIVGHFLNLVVLSFVCSHFVNFRSCDRPILPHEWFLEAKQYAKVQGKTEFHGLSFQKHSRQPASHWSVNVTTRWERPFQKPFSISLVYISTYLEDFGSSFTGLEIFPQILAKSSAVACTHISKLWVNALNLLLSPAVWIYLKVWL